MGERKTKTKSEIGKCELMMLRGGICGNDVVRAQIRSVTVTDRVTLRLTERRTECES